MANKWFKINGTEVLKENILANDVTFPWEGHPHHMTAWLFGIPISNAIYGAYVVWASHEQDAMDELADSGLLDQYQVDEDELKKMTQDEIDNDFVALGNASEPFDLQNGHIEKVKFATVPLELMCMWAEARGQGKKTLEDV